VAAAGRAGALLDAIHRPARLDRALALAFLAEGRYDAHRAFFRDLALAPARCPVVRGPDGMLRVQRGAAPPPVAMDAAEAARRTRALLDAAVERALAPHARAGVWLSGGLDSSAVAAAASSAWHRLGRDPADLRHYHHRPRAGPDEAWAARAVAAALGHDLVALRADDRDPFEGAEALFAELDFPPDGGGPRTSLRLARRMLEDGVGVFLTGDGGDELFAAPPPPTLRARVSGRLPERLRARLRRLVRPPSPLPGWLADARRAEPLALRDRPPPRTGLGREAAVRDASVRNARQAAIESWLGALGRTVGIAVACPLLDARIGDLVVQIPQALHRGPPAKRILRAACADRLPTEVLDRGPDQPAWEPGHVQDLERYGENWNRRWLEEGVLASGGLVPPEAAGAVLREAGSGRADAVYRALALLGLEIWCRSRSPTVSRGGAETA
jgi:asparagine synthetase B (glutamine-hydrolysing)